MIEFTLNMPEWEKPYAVATVKVLDDSHSFLAQAVLLGYEPADDPEDYGITFNTECSKTGAKHALILFNRRDLDIETITHEIRHAYFWVMSNQHGILKLDLLDEAAEEAFCRRLDILTARCVSTILQRLGDALVWKSL